MKNYAARNLLPIIWEIIFVISCFTFPKEYFIYLNLLFYLGVTFYFLARKEISFREWGKNIKSGKTFWKQVALTILFLIGAFALTVVLENMFPDWNTGTIGLQRDTWGKLFIFAISTIILPPLAEEMFYRKSMIDFKNNKWLCATVLLSMFLYALEHSLTPWGIFLNMLWAVPLSAAYIKTKNIYVPMTAHFLVNLAGNGADVAVTAVRWLQ